jgi:hypothetical protein
MQPGRNETKTRRQTWAGAHIIEDDYDSEFRYGRMPVHALRELDEDRVIYVGTFSKNMFMGFGNVNEAQISEGVQAIARFM